MSIADITIADWLTAVGLLALVAAPIALASYLTSRDRKRRIAEMERRIRIVDGVMDEIGRADWALLSYDVRPDGSGCVCVMDVGDFARDPAGHRDVFEWQFSPGPVMGQRKPAEVRFS